MACCCILLLRACVPVASEPFPKERDQFLRETQLVLFVPPRRSRSVLVFGLPSPWVLEIRHLSIFCGFNNSPFVLFFAQQTLSLPHSYLED